MIRIRLSDEGLLPLNPKVEPRSGWPRLAGHFRGGTSMPSVNRCVRLAIENNDSGERAETPKLKAKFREVAGQYRDKALHLLDERALSPIAFEITPPPSCEADC